MKKVLITEEMHPALVQGLSQLGYNCTVDAGISAQDLQVNIPGYSGIIVGTRIHIDKELIDAGSDLLFIARAGSGMENIDVQYAESRNIVCINSPEGNANAVGEHSMGLLLAMFHNIPKSFLETSHEQWLVQENRVHELEGKVIGIIGYGNTGRAFAQKLQPFSMKVLAYDKYVENYGDEYARQTSMSEIFALAEIVSFHIPLTDETRWMVNESYLQRFQKTIHLINTSRGKIIRHRDVLRLIRQGKISGAALDVFENENFSSHTQEERNVFVELIKTNKVIFTPHIAGKSFESGKKIADVLIKKISEMQ